MPRTALSRPLEALAVPGRYLVGKIAELKKQQLEQSRRKVTERELAHLNHKICAICISAKATMQTFPCGHRVVCRKCFVKTIQMAVSQRMLPLRCVICRAKILRLKQSSSSSSHEQTTEFISRGMTFRDPTAGVPTKISLYVSHSKDPALLISEHVRRVTPPPRLSFHRPGRLTRPLLPIPETEELEIVHSVRSVTPSLCTDDGDLWSPQDNLKLGAPAKADLHAKRWGPLARLRRLRSPSLFKSIRNKCK